MTLYLWKAPVTEDEEEAKRLVDRFDERDDASAFEPNADLTKVAEELVRRFPDEGKGPWADGPPEPSDRIVVLSIRWGADNAVLDAIAQLAYDHQLVYYDPQGPYVGIPDDPSQPTPDERPGFVDILKVVLMGLVAAGIFWLGWSIEIPVLNWILMIVGGFATSVVLFLLGALVFGPKEEVR